MPANLAYRSLAEPSPGTAAPTPEKYYPSVSLNLADFPELKALDVGDGVELCFKAKVCSKHESESYSDLRVDLLSGAIYDVSPVKPVIPKTAAVAIKNDADTALEAITNLKKTGSG
mgnify:CR=1 FL=1